MKSLLILILFLIGFSSIYSQTSSISDNIWISCGPGGFFNDNINFDALSFYLSANWLSNKSTETANGSKHWNNICNICTGGKNKVFACFLKKCGSVESEVQSVNSEVYRIYCLTS